MHQVNEAQVVILVSYKTSVGEKIYVKDKARCYMLIKGTNPELQLEILTRTLGITRYKVLKMIPIKIGKKPQAPQPYTVSRN